jgi:hypothetical protein
LPADLIVFGKALRFPVLRLANGQFRCAATTMSPSRYFLFHPLT